MGFPRGYLMRLFTMKGQKMAWKVGKHRNNAILFDTDERQGVTMETLRDMEEGTR